MNLPISYPEAEPPLPPPAPVPPPGRASRVYLLLVFLLVGDTLLAGLLPRLRWLLLLVSDPLLLAAVLWAVRREKRPVRPALRWNWPGWAQVGLGLALGFGAYGVGALIQVVVTLIFGQVPGVDVRQFAGNPLLLVVFLVSAVVLAPPCEELIFRGYLLGIYERCLGPGGSLWLVSFLFALLHLQLFGIFSLLPAAFLLTYLALRSGSVAAGIAAHFAFNFTSSVLGLVALNSSPLLAGLLACGFLASAPLVGIFAFQAFRRAVPAQPPAPRLALNVSWWASYAPLLGAGVVYLFFAGMELLTYQFPQVLAGPMPAQQSPAWQLPLKLTYQSEPILPFETPAEMTCTLQSAGQDLSLACQLQQPAQWMTPASSLAWSVRWGAKDRVLKSGRYSYTGSGGDWSATLAEGPSGSPVYAWQAVNGSSGSRTLPAAALIDGAWPWQLVGLPFDQLGRLGARVSLATIGARGQLSLHQGAVQVKGQEPLKLDTGDKIVWSVQAGNEQAFYDTNSPGLPLQFTWGGVTYDLKSSGPP